MIPAKARELREQLERDITTVGEIAARLDEYRGLKTQTTLYALERCAGHQPRPATERVEAVSHAVRKANADAESMLSWLATAAACLDDTLASRALSGPIT